MVLDHVDGLELCDEQAKKHGNELYTLRNLAVGLAYLNHQVAKIERATVGPIQGKLKLFSTGNIPGIAPETLSLVTCFFHWYAVSACNYVQLVGCLAKQVDSTKPTPTEYAKTVMPAVLMYRNKVAAHLAMVVPRHDNPADLLATLLFPIVLTDEGFHVGGTRVCFGTAEESQQNQHDLMWFLTKTHRELAKRYWPEEHGRGN